MKKSKVKSLAVANEATQVVQTTIEKPVQVTQTVVEKPFKSLASKQVANGELPTNSKSAPTCLDDILGRRYFMYKERDEKEYQKNLEKLNLAELQRHAIEIANIIPSADKRDTLINKLVKVYLERKYRYVAQNKPLTAPPVASEEVNLIMARGR